MRCPGQDEEAGVVDHEVEIGFALFIGPSDKAVAWLDFPCGRAEAEHGQRCIIPGENRITDLRTDKSLVAEVVIAGDVLVPQPADLFPLAGDDAQAQGPGLVEGGGNRRRRLGFGADGDGVIAAFHAIA